MNVELELWSAFLFRIFLASGVLLLSTMLMLLAFRNQSAATKHLIATLSMISLAFLPLSGRMLPSWEMGWIDAKAVFAACSLNNPSTHAADYLQNPIDGHNAASTNHVPASLDSIHNNNSGSADDLETTNDVFNLRGEPTRSALTSLMDDVQRESKTNSFRGLVLAILSVYLLGILLGIARLCTHCYAVRKLTYRVTTSPVKMRISEYLSHSLDNCGDHFYVTEQVCVPMVVGILRPKIFLPQCALDWPFSRIKAALAHELAHIRRHDLAIQLISKLIQIAYWPQPLVHLLISWTHHEREAACDDQVVINHGFARLEYATHLLAVASGLISAKRSNPVWLSMSNCSNLERRINKILADDKVRLAPSRANTLLICSIAALLFSLAATVSPFSPSKTASAQVVDAAPEISAAQKSPFDRFRDEGAPYLLRQDNTNGLFHGLPQRLDPFVIGKNQFVVATQGNKQWTGKLTLKIDSDEAGEVWIGFFEDARWWVKPPLQVRKFPGAGEHVVENLPEVPLYIGAMIGSLPKPKALGICSDWPGSVVPNAIKHIEKQVVISKQFVWFTYPQLNTRNYTGDWPDVADESQVFKIYSKDQQGNPIPYCDFSLLTRKGGKPYDFVAFGSDADGTVVFNHLDMPFSILAMRRFFDPVTLAERVHAKKMVDIIDPLKQSSITISWGEFPIGRHRVFGVVKDQNGQPVQGYHLALIRDVGNRRSSEESSETFDESIPVYSADGSFDIRHLVPGQYTIAALAFDQSKYVFPDFDNRAVFSVDTDHPEHQIDVIMRTTE